MKKSRHNSIGQQQKHINKKKTSLDNEKNSRTSKVPEKKKTKP